MWIRSTKPVANNRGQYLFAAVNIKKYSPANVGMAHSNQRYFLEHSEEPYNKNKYLSHLPQICIIYRSALIDLFCVFSPLIMGHYVFQLRRTARVFSSWWTH